MSISNIFEFLVSEYKLNYARQEFRDCYGGYWTVITYSYYNDSGCFTIFTLPERQELDFFYSENFCNNLSALCKSRINIESIGNEIWQKAKKKIFFGYRQKFFLQTLAKAIRNNLEARGEFFGVKASRD